MLVIAGCLAALLFPLLLGRGLRDLLRIRLRALSLVWAALLTQVVVVEVPMPHSLAVVTHLASYLLAAAFLWLNRALRGLPLVALGAACNGVTIALNGGTLPASAQAVRRAGISAENGFLNSAVLQDPVLPWLGDVFAWPQPLPLANVFSVGDVLIVAGVGLISWRVSRPRGGRSLGGGGSLGGGSLGGGSLGEDSSSPASVGVEPVAAQAPVALADGASR